MRLIANLVVGLHVEHERRDHGDRLLSADVAALRLRDQEIVQLVVGLRLPVGGGAGGGVVRTNRQH